MDYDELAYQRFKDTIKRHELFLTEEEARYKAEIVLIQILAQENREYLIGKTSKHRYARFVAGIMRAYQERYE